jgi:hypothetical protein
MSEGDRYTSEQVDQAIRHLKAGLELVPAHMRPGVLGYVQHGRPTGGFLESLFDGDLDLAERRADPGNAAAFEKWRELRRAFLPRACHGSRDRRLAWIKGGGLEGRRDRQSGNGET